MPWDVKRDPRCSESKPFGVVKRDDKELEGCHATRAAANRQLAALNAAERGKDMSDEQAVNLAEEDKEKAVQTGEIVGPGVPFGVTTFADLETAQQARASAQMVEEASGQFIQLFSNIMASDDVEDKSTAVTALAGEFIGKIRQVMTQKERALTQEEHYKEVAADEDAADDEDFQGGCRHCGFGEPDIVKELGNCPHCWNEVEDG